MLEILLGETRKADTLVQASAGVLAVLNEIKAKNPNLPIVFVSGIVTSDGPEKVWENLQKLGEYSQAVRDKHFPLAFSAADIFPREIIEGFVARGATNDAFLRFWEIVLRNGPFSDFVFAPGHERSSGSSLEMEIALELNLSMHLLDENGIITRV